MKLDRFIRVAIAVVIFLVFVFATGALLFITEAALNVWDRLRAGPAALLYAYVAVIVSLAVATAWFIWRLVVKKKVAPARSATPLSKNEIERRLHEAAAAGVDVSGAQAELQALAARQAAGAIHLCFFGEVSTGKSSLLKALVPDADVLIDVVAGSTDDVRHYRWRNAAGSEIYLTDVPGIGGHEAGLHEAAAAEARRAHLVLFVCDGDLTRAELNAVSALLTFDKPLILVLNNAHRFDAPEQATSMQRLLLRPYERGGELRRHARRAAARRAAPHAQRPAGRCRPRPDLLAALSNTQLVSFCRCTV